MALQGSGSISTDDIVQEFGFPSGTIMELRLQKPSSTIQIWINAAWRNCNMCSLSLPPIDGSGHSLPTDFYSYNHSTYGLNSCTVQGTASVINEGGYTYNYTAGISGYNTTGTTYNWIVSGGTINSGQGTTVINVTWTNAAAGSVTLEATASCDGITKTNILYTSLVCTNITGHSIGGNLAINSPENQTYTLTYNGSVATSIVWSVGSYGTILSGQGTNSIVVFWNFTNPYAAQSSTINCIVTNQCNSVSTNTLNISPSVYSSVEKSGTFSKSVCGTNGWGSPITYIVYAGTYKAYKQTDADNAAQSDVDTNGQNNTDVNSVANGLGNLVGTSYCTWGSDYINTNIQKQCDAGFTGTYVNYVQGTNAFTSLISLADANYQRDLYGQTYANDNGVCTSNVPTVTMNSFEIYPNYNSGQFGSVINITSSGDTTVDINEIDGYGTRTLIGTLSVQEGTRNYNFTGGISSGDEGYHSFEAVVYGVTNYSMETTELLMNFNSITASITNNGGGSITINVTNPQGLYINVAYCSGNFGSICARDYVYDFQVGASSSNSSVVSGFNQGNSITLMCWGPYSSVSAYRDIALTVPNDPI